MNLTDEQRKLIIRFQKQEITGHAVYRAVAERQTPHNRAVLEKIAADEMAHYRIFKRFSGTDTRPGRAEVLKYRLISRILGPTFAVKLLEKNESDDQISYTRLQHIPDILPIIRDEEQHEKELIGLIREDRLNYMGSVVLGLNDALVELTGALAGLTFALRDPSLIALTGSITGIAAAFSMAASEYLQTCRKSIILYRNGIPFHSDRPNYAISFAVERVHFSLNYPGIGGSHHCRIQLLLFRGKR
jgi:VIT1/CCC1 family predicted Fe2+/Mn2+ transporter